MVQPIYYMQTDPRWKNANYSAKGESKTIGGAGCGVACSAMVIATLKDKNVTPVETANWSMAHGYKALNQGTYYSYFVPQFNAYGIKCKKLNNSNLYGKSTSTYHTEALNALKKGDWVIACMGKGNWTSSGHFILVYGYENGYVYINDPASKASKRIKNTWNLFASQVKYLWAIEVPESLKNNNTTNNTTTSSKRNPIVEKGQKHAIDFTGVKIQVYGIVGSETKKMKARVLQHAMNLDYGNTIAEDGEFGTKSKNKLDSHYVEKGEKQYMVTAAEILMELNGIDPNGVEYPGQYGNGLVNASKKFFGDDGLKITATEFLKLIN